MACRNVSPQQFTFIKKGDAMSNVIGFAQAEIKESWPHYKNNQGRSYGQGWGIGLNTAWDQSINSWDEEGHESHKNKIDEITTILNDLEKRGEKGGLDHASHSTELAFYRGLVDGYKDAQHEAALRSQVRQRQAAAEQGE